MRDHARSVAPASVDGLEKLSHTGLAFVLFIALGRLIDSAGASDGRSERGAIVEAVTRGRLLVRQMPKVDWNRIDPESLEAARRKLPDPAYFSKCVFDASPDRWTNRAFVALLVAWLSKHYKEEQSNYGLSRPSAEGAFVDAVLHLLPLPEDVPLIPAPRLLREKTRRLRGRHPRTAYERKTLR